MSRLPGHLAAFAAGIAIAVGITGGGVSADPPSTTAVAPPTGDHRAAPPHAMRSAGVRVVARRDDLPARITAKLDELHRGPALARLRGYFPATSIGAELAAYTLLADDIPDDTEAGIFARRDLEPDLTAHPDELLAAARAALLAMPRGDGTLYETKETLASLVSTTAAPALAATVLRDYLAVEDRQSMAYSHAEHELERITH